MRPCALAALALTALPLAGCGTMTTSIVAGTIGATAAGSYSPNTEIEQTYYLGVFDPHEQVPPSVYRVRVKGQASFLSATKFASGWVPADLVDSLSSHIGFDAESGNVQIGAPGSKVTAELKTGRRLILFGPEGFREAPRTHRLVVVMGSTPEDFFEAIDTSLGAVAQIRSDQRNEGLARDLFEALQRVKAERERLADLERDVAADLGKEGAGR